MSTTAYRLLNTAAGDDKLHSPGTCWRFEGIESNIRRKKHLQLRGIAVEGSRLDRDSPAILKDAYSASCGPERFVYTAISKHEDDAWDEHEKTAW
jgi:hypothetical protein